MPKSLATILCLGKWLTSVGPYLSFAVFSSYEPTQETFLTWIETHPILTISIFVSTWLTSRILNLWEYSAREQNRRVINRQWAKQNRWNYSPNPDKAISQRFRFLRGIPGYAIYDPKRDRERLPPATHILKRPWNNHHAIAYTQYSNPWHRSRGRRKTKSARPYYFAITILETQQHFPKLFIRRQHWSDHFFKIFTDKHSKLEISSERKQLSIQEFVIHCGETRKQMTYRAETYEPDVLDEFLTEEIRQKLSQLPPHTSFEIDQGVLALFKEGQLDLRTLNRNLDYLDGIFDLIPEEFQFSNPTNR